MIRLRAVQNVVRASVRRLTYRGRVGLVVASGTCTGFRIGVAGSSRNPEFLVIRASNAIGLRAALGRLMISSTDAP